MTEIIKFKNATEVFEYLSPWSGFDRLEYYVFRGQSDAQWPLTPTALRTDDVSVIKLERASGFGADSNLVRLGLVHQIEAEYRAIRSFYKLADQNGLPVPISNLVRRYMPLKSELMVMQEHERWGTWIPEELRETAALAQHYGIPTRLLDWTSDPFVALFFAARGALESEKDCAVWALNQDDLVNKWRLRGMKTLDFVTPHYAGNPNLAAQRGLLTMSEIHAPTMQEIADQFKTLRLLEVDRRPLEELLGDVEPTHDSDPILKKLMIPKSEAAKTCDILDRMGYDYSRVFPGYSGVVGQIMNKHYYQTSSQQLNSVFVRTE